MFFMSIYGSKTNIKEKIDRMKRGIFDVNGELVDTVSYVQLAGILRRTNEDVINVLGHSVAIQYFEAALSVKPIDYEEIFSFFDIIEDDKVIDVLKSMSPKYCYGLSCIWLLKLNLLDKDFVSKLIFDLDTTSYVDICSRLLDYCNSNNVSVPLYINKLLEKSFRDRELQSGPEEEKFRFYVLSDVRVRDSWFCFPQIVDSVQDSFTCEGVFMYGKLYSKTKVARQFGITTRTVRYYFVPFPGIKLVLTF